MLKLTMAAGLLLPVACVALPAQGGEPAVITSPTARSRAELARVLSEALNGAPVTLADDALTRESHLSLERARPRDAEGRLLEGRERRSPEQFQLQKDGRDCVLVHPRTGRRWILASVTCAPL